MNTIDVLCTRRHAIGSLAIRAWHRAAVSHVALVDRDRGEVIEAVMFHGVRTRPLEDAIAAASYHAIRTITVPRPADAIAAARSQIGKRYDWRANLGVGLRTDWQDADAWNCIELAAWAIGQGGRRLFHDDRNHRLWPELLHLPRWELEA